MMAYAAVELQFHVYETSSLGGYERSAGRSGCVLVNKVEMEQVFVPVRRFCSVSIIPPMLYTHIYLNNTVVRRTSGTLGAVRQSNAFPNIGQQAFKALLQNVVLRCHKDTGRGSAVALYASLKPCGIQKY
jgi:RNase P/RNase MRP subunit POP5